MMPVARMTEAPFIVYVGDRASDADTFGLSRVKGKNGSAQAGLPIPIKSAEEEINAPAIAFRVLNPPVSMIFGAGVEKELEGSESRRFRAEDAKDRKKASRMLVREDVS